MCFPFLIGLQEEIDHCGSCFVLAAQKLITPIWGQQASALVKYEEGKANKEVPLSSVENDRKKLTFFIAMILQISASIEERIRWNLTSLSLKIAHP